MRVSVLDQRDPRRADNRASGQALLGGVGVDLLNAAALFNPVLESPDYRAWLSETRDTLAAPGEMSAAEIERVLYARLDVLRRLMASRIANFDAGVSRLSISGRGVQVAFDDFSALGFQFVSPEAARAWVARYYVNLTQNLEKLADYPANPNIAMVSGFMCAPTDEEAIEKAAGWTFFVFCLSHYGKHGIPAPGQGNMWELYQEWRRTPKAEETLRAGLIGSPETIRQRLREFEAANVDQVILLNQAGRTTHADICRSLELFAREVMPEFHARETEHQKWKQAVLDGEIQLPELDVSAYTLVSLSRAALPLFVKAGGGAVMASARAARPPPGPWACVPPSGTGLAR